MDAYDCGGSIGQQLVVCYAAHNAVNWYTPMPNGGNNSTAGPIPNVYLSQVTVTTPNSCAIDNSGNVLVTSGTTVIKIAYGTHTQTTLITGLTKPTHIAVDHNTGEILVADNRQLKRFTSGGAPASDYPSYGAAGGGQLGLYNPNNFFNITAVCAGPGTAGDFYVTEDGSISPDGIGGVRRVAHFARNGSLLNQWLTASPWSAYAAADPDDPTVVWAPMDRDPNQNCRWLARLTVDYTNNTFVVHSVYDIDGQLGTGLIDNEAGSFPTGGIRPRVLKHNGVTYLGKDGPIMGLLVLG